MVETIMDLKNNRKHTQEHLSKLRKIKAQISSKHVEALGVTLDDIINIETKGKWWLVGAAWKQTKGEKKWIMKRVIRRIHLVHPM